jgi:phosphatidylserine decarboxylase
VLILSVIPNRFAPGVRRYAVPVFVFAGVAGGIAPPIGVLALLVGGAILWFFRDPSRQPSGPGIVAPGEGHVTVIREEGEQIRIGIFLNVTDVHVARAPIAGEVTQCTHREGAHRPAFMKESPRNERVDIAVTTPDGPVEISLIAGAVARRIYPYVHDGMSIDRAQRIGHIDFGSRVDVLLPPKYTADDLLVTDGQKVRAGESIVARRE